ncbi:MAG: glycoside hydrolase family 30 beta sandwich domain-containing protein [Methylobacter sp.]|nr:glycoside hydrolase family 30 beta sandwich domain-containing protein [Methylobacter sp.]
MACAKTLDSLEATAFLNIDGTVAVVVLNRAEQAIDFILKSRGLQAKTSIPALGIKTFVF